MVISDHAAASAAAFFLSRTQLQQDSPNQLLVHRHAVAPWNGLVQGPGSHRGFGLGEIETRIG